MRLMGSFVTGYGGKLAPPFSRFYMGGEQDVRGFEIWGISPWAFVPDERAVVVLNDDGSARTQKVIRNGQEVFEAVTQRIPIYTPVFVGGDTQAVGNLEYRIPIAGPVTLAAFFDAGLNRISLPGQLRLNEGRLTELNFKFPQAGFDGRAIVVRDTQRIRTSTGLELQVLMPVVNAPFRLYWAYNPTITRTWLQPPIVLDRSAFPNQATFLKAVADFGTPLPFFEQRRTFRFTIGRTF